ncbi:metalloprotease [Gelidibacter salicanalis]|uniref:metalloprotease n=1 Tax=Gelidibacter salicanalis TaxID=291193 RepID=UPI001F2E2972|nr:metalloprotease [Gelidibacter salicanalis]
MTKYILFSIILLCSAIMSGQNEISIDAQFNMANRSAKVSETIRYQNNSQDTLKTIYLNDWNNSFSTKRTPLADRFTEEYSTKFHFAKNEMRGFTNITSIKATNGDELINNRLKLYPDVIEVQLTEPLPPNQSYHIQLFYNLQFPDHTFTDYGVTDSNEFNLKYWYITPAVYDGVWHYYSNKNLDDLFVPKATVNFKLEFPKNYGLFSELDIQNITQNDSTQTFHLYGKDRVDSKLYLNKFPKFNFVQTDNFTVITNIETEGITPTDRAIITDKITKFITKNLGPYPHNYLLVTDIEYRKDPLYGINQLPKFINPFPGNLQYELKLLKTTLKNYLNNTVVVNPRKDYWLKDGIQIYYLMKYVKEQYPDLKLLGTLSDFWGVRSFHAADVDFNEQYNLYFMQMARTNRDQALTTAKDSLLKFNANIAGKYKAGIGLKYLDDFVNADVLEKTIQQYVQKAVSEPTTLSDFESLLKQNTDKDVDWFFSDYINSNKKIDFRIKDIIKTKDSVTFTIKNKRNNDVPISLFTLKHDSILSKQWIEHVKGSKTLTIPHHDATKLVLNYDNTIPEYNLRDNWKSLQGWFFNNKPLQFRLFKDIEDPNYNQVFLMPLVEFNNIYDGLTLGAKMYNKTLLMKNFSYKLSPKYSFNSKTLTGGASGVYTQHVENRNLFRINYGLGGSYSSFAENAFVTLISPSVSFYFRDKDNYRSNKLSYLNFRYLDISRTNNNSLLTVTNPDYSVFNIRYVNAHTDLIDYSKFYYDFQAAEKFGKLSVNYEWRKLTENNRQFNFRFFAGSFLYNKTDENSDYFSFALDRPTDYLFDYNYLGRSEASGIFSQQIIIAEGGFKSKLDPSFANQWMTTVNVSTTLWRYIEAYGDIGLVKNRSINPEFVYDSGIRLNLVTDYFELYFPIYSNLGWEVDEPNYSQRIRIKFTLDPQALLGLFRRRWY